MLRSLRSTRYVGFETYFQMKKTASMLDLADRIYTALKTGVLNKILANVADILKVRSLKIGQQQLLFSLQEI